MRTTITAIKFFAPAVLLIASACPAQNSTDKTPTTKATASPIWANYFHLEFIVKEFDAGKLTSTRTYAMDVRAGMGPSTRASYRSAVTVPEYTEGKQTAVHDIWATNIDCSEVQTLGTDHLSLRINTSISDAPDDKTPGTSSGSFMTLAVIGKPTIVFTADGPAPNRKIQMEVIATPISVKP